jgi:formylglycine-generating enzyme required for sulfatase activity
MHGNVAEWCGDWMDELYGNKHDSDGSFIVSRTTDPTGPDTGSAHVVRGGGYYESACLCRSAYRDYFHPFSGSNHIGFRVVFPAGIGEVRTRVGE